MANKQHQKIGVGTDSEYYSPRDVGVLPEYGEFSMRSHCGSNGKGFIDISFHMGPDVRDTVLEDLYFDISLARYGHGKKIEAAMRPLFDKVGERINDALRPLLEDGRIVPEQRHDNYRGGHFVRRFTVPALEFDKRNIVGMRTRYSPERYQQYITKVENITEDIEEHLRSILQPSHNDSIAAGEDPVTTKYRDDVRGDIDPQGITEKPHLRFR